ncbi:MAG: hypothetical protein PHS32_22965 [Rhodoferax sp.]|uniref:hypothetical protein n=1 Tax=Rhodoferax sp. TaxID=50421 RepID=UPI002608BC9A|nr:hypothetical protein [Rhodoferax sp.]MDD5336609.1 hypothetical protein [Rhodoferax sp.]
MSGSKRMFEDHEAKRGIAIQIAIEAGVLEQCEFHDIAYEGNEEIESAYKLGNGKFSRGEFRDTFESRREMTDYIKNVVEDHPAEECPSCAHMRES